MPGKAGGNPLMVSYEDMVVAYAGNGKGSVIEDALNGPMATMLPPDEKDVVIAWARRWRLAGVLPERHQAYYRQAVHGLP